MNRQIYDTIIRNGLVVDGTGASAYYADVALLDGRIADIGALGHCRAKEEIDAAGMIVAPGFVTVHSHYDAALFWDPYCSNSGENGVTTLVNANCGFGFAPVRPADRERTMAMMETTEQIPVEHQRAALTWAWETFPQFLDTVRAMPKGVNVATYLPLNPLLIYVMGVEAAKSRRPTAAEMAEMHRLINEAMDAGAIGISMSAMGIEGNSHVDFDGTPMPTDCIDHDVLVDLGRALAERGEGVIQLLSYLVMYGDRTVTERMAEMARGTGVRVVHNAIVTSDIDPELAPKEIAWLDGLRARGLDVTAPTLLHRGWLEGGIRELVTAGGQLSAIREIVACKADEDLKRLLADPGFRRRFQEEYDLAGPSADSASFNEQIILDVGEAEALQPLVGRLLGDIARERGQHVVETLLELTVASDLKLLLKSLPVATMDAATAARTISHSGVTLGVSDGGAHCKVLSMGHYGTDLLVWLNRETGAMSLEELHFQLGLKPARAVQIRDRGAIQPGFWADLLIYDLQKLHVDTHRMQLVHDMPNGDWRMKSVAGGYERILVNGVTTHHRDRPTGATPGQLVRVTRSAQVAHAHAAE